MKQSFLSIMTLFVLYMFVQFLGLLAKPTPTLAELCEQEIAELDGCASDLCCELIFEESEGTK